METTAPELEKAKVWFECWREPSTFSDQLSQVRPLLNKGRFLYVREGKWYREAWALNAYSKFCSFDAIRLNHDDPPDAFAKHGKTEIPIEITEVMEPERRPAAFYRQSSSKISLDPVENWIKRAEELPGALEASIKRKSRNSYPANTELLIYLNIQEFGIRQKKIESQISSILTQPAPFALIHVLWQGKLFCSNGEVKVSSSFDECDDDWDDGELFKGTLKD